MFHSRGQYDYHDTLRLQDWLADSLKFHALTFPSTAVYPQTIVGSISEGAVRGLMRLVTKQLVTQLGVSAARITGVQRAGAAVDPSVALQVNHAA